MQERWDSSSLDITRTMLVQLDEQRDRLIPIYKTLAEMVNSLSEVRKAASEFWHPLKENKRLSWHGYIKVR
jgi:hypothetical protein